MKKNILFVMAVAAIFAGCSSGEGFDEKEGNNIPGVTPNGEVEIVLGATGTNITVTPTRGVVDGWDNTPIAVWGLDKSAGADWSNASSVLFKDKYVTGKVTSSPKTGTVVLGPTGTEHYFYPMNSAVNFSFFACSPIPKPAITNAQQVTAVYDFAGDTDILWGKAETKDPSANGYNAKYIRQSTDDNTPNLSFQHLLTKLTFFASKGTEVTTTGGVTAKVKSVKILNVPSQATVNVAGAQAGTIQGNLNILSDFSIYNEGVVFGSDIDTVSPVTPVAADKGAKLGTVMLLPATSYTIRVTLTATTADNQTVEESGDYVIALEGKDFEKGKGYNVQLTVYDLQTVVLTATLAKWEDHEQIDTSVEIN
ncbi:fimbrillin family protein [Bacteroides congonensis]